MRDFKDLKVWHKAHRFVIDVYQQSRSFPAEGNVPPPVDHRSGGLVGV